MTTSEASFKQVEALIDEALDTPTLDANRALVRAQVAQAQATLLLAEQTASLVEQQRLANLLAATHLVPEGERQGIDAWGADSDGAFHSRLADSDTWELLLGTEGYEREKRSWHNY